MSATFPDSSSNPHDIRQYLQHVFINKHDIPPARAEELASQWEFGRGRDFFESDIGHFSHLFGYPLAKCLLGTICDDEWRQWRPTLPGTVYYYGRFVLGVSMLLPIWQAIQVGNFSDQLVLRFLVLLAINSIFYIGFTRTMPNHIREPGVLCGMISGAVSFLLLFLFHISSD